MYRVRGKRVLDIGCNSGAITMQLLRPNHGAQSVVGVDIDETLIKRARNTAQRYICSDRKIRKKDDLNVSFLVGNVADTSWPFDESNQQQSGSNSNESECRFDCILCLSVTKWIQLNHGDDGIKTLIRRVDELLEIGGIFVLGAARIYTALMHISFMGNNPIPRVSPIEI